MHGRGRELIDHGGKLRAGLANDVAHKIRGETLALIMPDGGEPHSLLIAEEAVIANLARQIEVGPTLKSGIYEEIACTATERHSADGAVGPGVMLHASCAESMLYETQECQGIRRINLTNDAAATAPVG